MRPALVAFCGLTYRLQRGRCSDVRLLMSVPADSDGITPDWLTAALREAGAIYHARVTVHPVRASNIDGLGKEGIDMANIAGPDWMDDDPGRGRWRLLRAERR